MIAVRDLSFAYGRRTVFRDLSFDVEAGECAAVFGPNGSGKSTLCRILCGAVRPRTGSVKTTGRIGYVPQGDALLTDATVGENIRFFRDLTGGGDVSLPDALRDRGKTRVSDLSGGLRKQLSIACALIGDPDAVIFDEPCASLDLSFRGEVAETVNALKAGGKSVLYVGHDPAEFAGFCDKLILMREEPGVLTRAEWPGRLPDEIAGYFH